MTSKSHQLQTSFPWLSDAEAAEVAERLDQVPRDGAVADQMTAIAEELDSLGLPPTSSLLLALAGRGSKGTAVAISRASARRRFESARARLEESPGADESTGPGAVPADVSRLINLMEQLSASPAHDGIGKDVLREVIALRAEFSWLKSCIDTERQLRKHEEKGGTLQEPRAAVITPASRAHLVATVSSGLERARYKPDPADGAVE